MSNIYHILYKEPATEKYQLPIYLEKLAERLLHSGLIRIDAGIYKNYVRYTLPYEDKHFMFTFKELHDKKLVPRIESIIAKIFYTKYKDPVKLGAHVASEISKLKLEMAKNILPEEDLEMKLARILVQSAHPVAIELILIEKAEIYLTYSYSIGDMLDIPTWKSHGDNGGMQSSFGKDLSIFVSSGGDPLGENKALATYGDGWPALARMMVIAAQEIGHYADIIRNNQGYPIGRHSSNEYGNKANPEVSLARKKDMDICKNMLWKLNNKTSFNSLLSLEKEVILFKKLKKILIKKFFYIFYMYILQFKFFIECGMAGIYVVKNLPTKKYYATYLNMCLKDMQFNLNPINDAYNNPNPQMDDAIKCIEALARVPQQEIKWGCKVTKALMKNLWCVYYKQVIPGCKDAYKNYTGKAYSNFKLSRLNIFAIIWYRFFKKSKFKAGYKIFDLDAKNEYDGN